MLNRCTQPVEPATDEEKEEKSAVRTACIKAFLLLLLGYTIFSDKNRTAEELIFFLAGVTM